MKKSNIAPLQDRRYGSLLSIASALACVSIALGATAALAAEPAAELKLQDGAPDRYVVERGDTLWSISGKFLKDPWRWGDLWRMNKDQIKGKAKDIGGKIQEGVGKAVGSSEQQAKGLNKQVEGKVQEKAGDVKDIIKGNR